MTAPADKELDSAAAVITGASITGSAMPPAWDVLAKEVAKTAAITSFFMFLSPTEI